MKVCFYVLVAWFAVTAHAQEKIKILATCLKQPGLVMEPSEFVEYLQNQDVPSARISQAKVSCNEKVTMYGDKATMDNSDFFSVEIDKKDLARLIRKREAVLKNRDKNQTQLNLATTLINFQENWGMNMCDFLIPGRFKEIRAEDLENRATSPTKTEAGR
ncbi:MAG: hypothetical protein AB7G93_23485 [Bdellovibrionales bacterium]